MNHNFRWLLFSGLAILIYFGIRYLYFQPRLGAGDNAPNMEATLANGQPFRLSDLEGRYVLLDFWGSWCGPCIASFPELRQLYKDFHKADFENGAGFEIVSIAVEKDASRWPRALQRLQPSWPYQVLDLSTSLKFFNSPIAELYGIKQLPTKILIGPEGEVIDSDLSIAEVREYLITNGELRVTN